MEKYINMNDSFGGKNSISSTKSFQTSYEQCIESLKQQVQNHKKALTMAEKLVEHYKQQNQRLSQELQKIKQTKDRTEQKYEVLQKLFLKFDRQKEKQIKKQARRSQQKHLLQVQTLNLRYEGYLTTLNQRVYLLENQLRKYKQKQRQWQQFEEKIERQIKKQYVHLSRQTRQKIIDDMDNLDSKKFKLAQQQKFDKIQNFNGLDKIQDKRRYPSKSRAKQASSSCGAKDVYDRAELVKKDSSLTNKDKKVFKTSQFMRLNTEEDYHSHKQNILRTVQKNPKISVTYDNFFTEYKHYK